MSAIYMDFFSAVYTSVLQYFAVQSLIRTIGYLKLIKPARRVRGKNYE